MGESICKMLALRSDTALPVATEVVMTSASRPSKHDISFLVHKPTTSSLPMPPKRERLMQRSSLVSDLPASSVQHQQQIPLSEWVPASAPCEMQLPIQPQVVFCSECPFAADTTGTLSVHARASHPHKPFACRVCGRCFSEKGNMNKHFRTVHLKQRKHQCKTCNRQFAFLDGLNRHISMVHLDRRPFECTECQCPGGRHSVSQICTHVCGMKFKQKSHRRRHIRSVHQSQPLHLLCFRCSMPVLPNQRHICAAVASILGPHNTPVLQ